MPARIALLAALTLCGCGIPRDASHTLDHVRGGTLRVGIVENTPWVVDRGATVEGIEGRLVGEIASSIGARIEWVRAPEFELIRALHERHLEIVIGGFDSRVPWAREVAFTRPYVKTADGKRHVMAASPGENAWLMFLDERLADLTKRQSITTAGTTP